MSNQCINYKFCKGVAFPELMEDTCLLCGPWYSEGEGWGKLEFLDDPNLECSVCFMTGMQMKFPTNCGHSFCLYCSRNLLYYNDDMFDICPVKYGCSPCKHYIKDSKKSCTNRPCCDEDQNVLDTWEASDYDNFIRWNYDELNYRNQNKDHLVTKKCPLCRKVYERK
jgi:hypothetical protein